MKNSNPFLSNIKTGEECYDSVDKATYKGITLKTGFLLLLTVLISSIVGIGLPNILEYNAATFIIVLFISTFVGFFAAIIGRTGGKASKYCCVIYSCCEGLFLGAVTAIADEYIKGVGILAVTITLVIFGIMLALYATGVIKYNNKIRAIGIALTIGVLALTLITLIFAIASSQILDNIGYIILIEGFMLFYGVFSLIFDFVEAQDIVQNGCEKNAEWSVSLGLLISIIYIYIKVLHLLITIFGRRD